jgi:hypothetical protein
MASAETRQQVVKMVNSSDGALTRTDQRDQGATRATGYFLPSLLRLLAMARQELGLHLKDSGRRQCRTCGVVVVIPMSGGTGAVRRPAATGSWEHGSGAGPAFHHPDERLTVAAAQP